LEIDMSLNYLNLDAKTRKFMVEEIELDIKNGSLYLGGWLTERGRQDWPEMITDAAKSGSDATLSVEITKYGRLMLTAQRRKPGGFDVVNYQVPFTAPETMSEGEFNRFYVRGLCRVALAENISHLVIYRAKSVAKPRADSEAKIGSFVNPTKILEDLRTSPGLEPALGLPPGPNSGLSAKLP
jgi:hypothetical protein